MKESRLFQILYYILEKGRVTAPELADKFEVSVRTIYRDIDWISNAGIPIYTVQGKGGGLEIDSSFILNKSILTDAEREQIVIALKSLEKNSEFYKSELTNKLASIFNTKDENWIELDFSNWTHNKDYKSIFDKIKEAILNKNIISIHYSNMNSEKTIREIKPIRLLYKGGNWYVYSFCNLRQDFRFFKLARIRELNVLSKTYEEGFSDIDIDKEFIYSDTIHLLIRFDKSIEDRVYDDFSESITESDEYLYVEVELPDDYTTYSYILSFGDSAEVLEPIEARNKLKTMINNMAKKYIT